MYAIETDFGRFEGINEKEAKAKMRKAKRAHEAQQKTDNANRELAQLKAQAVGFKHLRRFMENEGSTAHSWLIRAGEKYFPVRHDADNPRQAFVKLGEGDAPAMDFYCWRPVAVLLAPSGDVELIWAQTDDGEIVTIAAAYHANQWNYVTLPAAISIEVYSPMAEVA